MTALPAEQSTQVETSQLTGRPRLRPGCAPLWTSHTSLTIGPHPALTLEGPLEHLAPVAAWVSTLDGTRTYSELIAGEPRFQAVLDSLIEVGCVLNRQPSITSAGERSLDRRTFAEGLVRVADDLSDDPRLIAERRSRTHISVVGDLALVAAIERICNEVGTHTTEPPAIDRRSAGAHVTLPLSGYNAAIVATLSETNEPVLATAQADEFLRRGIPHMAISIAGSRVLCGPWVAPGTSPCTRCWLLAEADRSTSAALVCTSEIGPARRTRLAPAASAIALAAALAAQRVTAFADSLLPVGCADALRWDGVAALTTQEVAFHPGCACSDAPR